MATKKDWLSHNHDGLYSQAKSTVDYLTEEVLTRIGVTGSVFVWYNGVFIPRHSDFDIAYLAWRNPADRTPAITTTLLTAEAGFKPVYRELYTGYLKSNPLVTDTDLVEMGLPKRSSGGKTPPTPPTTVVECTVDTSIPGMLIIHFRDRNEIGRAKPKGVHGVELRWIILDTPPADWSQLTNSVFDTRTPLRLAFSGEQRGKVVYFALRWENNIGEKGPWSEIYNAIIP
jgi:hypothetical protein